MVRPRKVKIVNFEPNVTYFKPRAVPLSQLEEIDLTIDELETLRLSNLENLSQSESAKKMKIHQSTFQRTLVRAREKITDALVNGKAIKIHGGQYSMPKENKTEYPGQGKVFGLQRKHQNSQSIGICFCQLCKYEQPHIKGHPCNQQKCPKCESLMRRK